MQISGQKLVSTFVLVVLYSSALFAQGEACRAAKAILAESRAKLVETYQAKDFDKAYKIATEMQSLGKASCPDQPAILLSLHMNVAQVQINRKKLPEAQKIYEENLELAEDVYGSSSLDFQKYTEDLLKLSVGVIGTDKFEDYALKLLETKKSRFGKNSAEYVNELVRMARFYAAWKKPDIAEFYFMNAMDVVDKLPVEKVRDKEKAVNRYRVFLINRYGINDGLAKGDLLMKSKFPDFPIRENVLNGYAYSLPRPAYPAQARNVNASGEVQVRVRIGTKGTVVEAMAVNGHPLLRGPAEAAAKEAKFLPTYVKGNIVEVTGTITYRFVD